MQELFFCELNAPGCSNTHWTLDIFDKLNPTSLFSDNIEWQKQKLNKICFTVLRGSLHFGS